MILKDDLLRYIPTQWSILHPNLYNIALRAVSEKLAQISHIKEDFYWRRLLDDPQFELGL